jgi:LysM repeat protein
MADIGLRNGLRPRGHCVRRWIFLVLVMGFSGPLWAVEYHVVQPGETLASIARERVGQYHAWMSIANLNDLSEPFTIKPGQILRLPDRPDSAAAKAPIVSTPPKTPVAPATPALKPIEAAPDRPVAPVRSDPPPVAAKATDATLGPAPVKTPSDLVRQTAMGQLDDWRSAGQERVGQWASQARDVRPSLSFFEEQWQERGEGPMLIALVAITLAWWFFFGACLRGACWFALVQTSLSRCVGLAFLLSILSVGTLIAVAMMLPDGGGQMIALIVVSYVLICVAMTKSLLGCKWRSVLTVFVMSSVVSNLVVVLAFLLVFSIDRIDRLEQVLDRGVEAAAVPEPSHAPPPTTGTPLSVHRAP